MEDFMTGGVQVNAGFGSVQTQIHTLAFPLVGCWEILGKLLKSPGSRFQAYARATGAVNEKRWTQWGARTEQTLSTRLSHD